jgi:hypothetical protein
MGGTVLNNLKTATFHVHVKTRFTIVAPHAADEQQLARKGHQVAENVCVRCVFDYAECSD